ncbi:putative uncharacterized protein [Aliivibrio wodanis]|uniref:Uncharacterized protein n=1 Tax=Aliivibrio wodanis TaxID=80852 RepID=A0A090I6N4_9GAMM|nr:putative uncharacterized protein [Aliivibrio wodanis]
MQALAAKEVKMSKIIYVIRSKKLNLVKIGEAKPHCLFDRLRNHQTGSADELELLGVHFGKYNSDKEIHKFFTEEHQHLEWFSMTNSLTSFVHDNFLLFPEPLSVLKDISWKMDMTMSPEIAAIQSYISGELNLDGIDGFLKDFDWKEFFKQSKSKKP